MNVNKVGFLFSSNAKVLPRTILLAGLVCLVLVVLLYMYCVYMEYVDLI